MTRLPAGSSRGRGQGDLSGGRFQDREKQDVFLGAPMDGFTAFLETPAREVALAAADAQRIGVSG